MDFFIHNPNNTYPTYQSIIEWGLWLIKIFEGQDTQTNYIKIILLSIIIILAPQS